MTSWPENCFRLKQQQRPLYQNSLEEYSMKLVLFSLVQLASWKITQKETVICTRLGNLACLTSRRYSLWRRTAWIHRDIGLVEPHLQKLRNTITLLQRVQIHRFAGFVYNLKELRLEEGLLLTSLQSLHPMVWFLHSRDLANPHSENLGTLSLLEQIWLPYFPWAFLSKVLWPLSSRLAHHLLINYQHYQEWK